MKILVVGATGFIGTYVVRWLTERGHEIAIFHRGRDGCHLFPNLQHIHGRHDGLPDLKTELVNLRVDVVLDVILYTERHALELVEACRGVTDRIIVISSSDVYRNYDGFRGKATAPPDPVPLSEDAPLRETLYPYRGSGIQFEWTDEYEKLQVERVVLGQPDLAATVLRLPCVYGPGDKQHRTLPYLRLMESGQGKLLISREHSRWRWTRGYVENVAAAIALAVTDSCAPKRIYNVGDASALTEREWIEKIGKAAWWSGEVDEIAAEELAAQVEPFDFRYELATDTSRIRAELSYIEPVALDEGLRRTVERERAQLGAS